MDNNISFKGAFWIGKVPSNMKKELLNPDTLGKHLIYNGVVFKKDTLLVTRDSFNYQVAKKLMNNNVYFRFYPNLNTRSGFKNNNIQSARDILESAENVLASTFDLKKYFAKDAYIEKTLKALGLNPAEYKTKDTGRGYRIILNKDKKIIGKFTIPDEQGNNYACLLPEKTYSSTVDDKTAPQRYLLNADGEKVFTYTNPVSFKDVFKKASEPHRTKVAS